MDVSVNYLAVFLAAVSTMVVGSIWYAPKVFGSAWSKMAGVKMNQEFSGKDMAKMYVPVFLASLVSAYVLAHVTFLSNNFFHNSYLQDALTTAFWVWLGFIVLRFFTHDIFEGRRKKLTLLNAGHELVTFLLMAFIIGLMGV